VYIQSGDPGDFDGERVGERVRGAMHCKYTNSLEHWQTGYKHLLYSFLTFDELAPVLAGYLIGVAGAELEKRTEDLQFVLVVSG
jgi:hypothetical protein